MYMRVARPKSRIKSTYPSRFRDCLWESTEEHRDRSSGIISSARTGKLIHLVAERVISAIPNNRVSGRRVAFLVY